MPPFMTIWAEQVLNGEHLSEGQLRFLRDRRRITKYGGQLLDIALEKARVSAAS